MKALLVSCLLAIMVLPTSPVIYDFKLKSIMDHSTIALDAYKGKKIMIVNTASKSPYTFQLEQMEKIFRAYGEKLVIIGIPTGDDFGSQELKTNEQIRDFFTYTYSVTFPVAEKSSALGTIEYARHPVFSYLIDEAHKLGYDDPVIKWNFTKFLLDENGKLLAVFPADVTPTSTDITSYLNNSRISGP
jgi:glutathione peroxidase